MNEALKKIFAVAFEPLAIFGITGIICLLLHQLRFKKIAYSTAIIVIFLFCIIPRLLWQISSSRYAISLIFPSILFTIYVIHFSPFRPFIKNIILMILAISMLAKDFHWHKNPDSIGTIAKITAQDALQFHNVRSIGFDTDGKLTAYRAGIDFDKAYPLTGESFTYHNIAQILECYRYDSAEAIYVFENTSDNAISRLPTVLNIPQAQWDLIGKCYRDHRQRRLRLVYRLRWLRSIKIDVPSSTAINKNSLLINNNFEMQSIPTQKELQLFYRFKAEGMTFFNNIPIWPQGWGISSAPGYNRWSAGEVGLDSKQPLEGLFSLRMCSQTPISIFSNSYIPVDNYIFFIKVQGTNKTRIGIGFYLYKDNKYQGLKIFCLITLKDEDIKDFCMILPQSFFDNATNFRCILFLQHGECQWDNLRFIQNI